jgi:hypothetical protein
MQIGLAGAARHHRRLADRGLQDIGDSEPAKN